MHFCSNILQFYAIICQMYGFQSHKRFGEFSELDVVDLQFFCTQLPQVHFGNFDD